jgi:hypothetical protein
MTRRRVLLFGLPTAVAAVAVAVWLLWPRTAITRENAAMIVRGMTLAEVEAVLGGRARTETTGPVELDWNLDTGMVVLNELNLESNRPACTWQSDRVSIYVQFSQDGRVTDCQVFPMRRAPESAHDKLRRWLGL